MKLGVNLGYWGLGMGPQEQLEVVQEAERLGYDSVWAAEAYGSDAATVLAWLAAGTSKIKLGSAIFQMPGRTPAMTAMTAATIDELSGGRMVLGIGSSGPQVAEGWHGQRFARQLQRTREYVAVVRKALSRERLEFNGETLELPLPDGPGQGAEADDHARPGADPDLPGGDRPEEHRAGRRDRRRLDPHLLLARARRPSSARCSRRAPPAPGARWTASTSPPRCQAYVSDDRELARNLMRPVLALYIGGMGSRKQNFYNNLVKRYGFEQAAAEIQDLYLEGKKEEAGAAIPAELIDMVSLCGPRDVVRERIAAFREAGVGTLMVSPMAWTAEDRMAQLRAVAELAA